MQIELDFFETAALSVAILYIGMRLKLKFEFLRKLFIPSPAVGGLFFSIITLICYLLFDVSIAFNSDVYDFTLMVFMTALCFEFDFSLFTRSFRFLCLLFLGATVVTVLENTLAIGYGSMLGIDPLVAMFSGTVKLLVDADNAGEIFAEISESRLDNIVNISMGLFTLSFVIALTVCGFIGSLMIRRYSLKPTAESNYTGITENEAPDFKRLPMATYQLIVAIGIGCAISRVMTLIGINLNTVIYPILVAIAMTNYSRKYKKFRVYYAELDYLSGLGMSLFLAACFVNIRLWTIFELNPQLIVLAVLQIISNIVLVYIFIFMLSGRSYDSAVIGAGCIGMFSGSTACGYSGIMVLNNTFGPSVRGLMFLTFITCFVVNIVNYWVISFLFLS